MDQITKAIPTAHFVIPLHTGNSAVSSGLSQLLVGPSCYCHYQANLK